MILVGYIYWAEIPVDTTFWVFVMACTVGLAWVNFNAIMGVCNFVYWIKDRRAARLG